jgi:hypothetical protein
MLEDKIYIADRQAFIEWKRKYTNTSGVFYAECLNGDEPKSYPCILLEMEDYNNKFGDYDTYYDFVYLTDFIIDYGKSV